MSSFRTDQESWEQMLEYMPIGRDKSWAGILHISLLIPKYLERSHVRNPERDLMSVIAFRVRSSHNLAIYIGNQSTGLRRIAFRKRPSQSTMDLQFRKYPLRVQVCYVAPQDVFHRTTAR